MTRKHPTPLPGTGAAALDALRQVPKPPGPDTVATIYVAGFDGARKLCSKQLKADEYCADVTRWWATWNRGETA